MTDVSSPIVTEEIVRRVRGEYLEMPGLKLTRQQAQRLWGLDEDTCIRILEFCVDIGFLRRSDALAYARATEGRHAFTKPTAR